MRKQINTVNIIGHSPLNQILGTVVDVLVVADIKTGSDLKLVDDVVVLVVLDTPLIKSLDQVKLTVAGAIDIEVDKILVKSDSAIPPGIVGTVAITLIIEAHGRRFTVINTFLIVKPILTLNVILLLIPLATCYSTAMISPKISLMLFSQNFLMRATKAWKSGFFLRVSSSNFVLKMQVLTVTGVTVDACGVIEIMEVWLKAMRERMRKVKFLEYIFFQIIAFSNRNLYKKQTLF